MLQILINSLTFVSQNSKSKRVKTDVKYFFKGLTFYVIKNLKRG